MPIMMDLFVILAGLARARIGSVGAIESNRYTRGSLIDILCVLAIQNVSDEVYSSSSSNGSAARDIDLPPRSSKLALMRGF